MVEQSGLKRVFHEMEGTPLSAPSALKSQTDTNDLNRARVRTRQAPPAPGAGMNIKPTVPLSEFK